MCSAVSLSWARRGGVWLWLSVSASSWSLLKPQEKLPAFSDSSSVHLCPFEVHLLTEVTGLVGFTEKVVFMKSVTLKLKNQAGDKGLAWLSTLVTHSSTEIYIQLLEVFSLFFLDVINDSSQEKLFWEGELKLVTTQIKWGEHFLFLWLVAHNHRFVRTQIPWKYHWTCHQCHTIYRSSRHWLGWCFLVTVYKSGKMFCGPGYNSLCPSSQSCLPPDKLMQCSLLSLTFISRLKNGK